MFKKLEMIKSTYYLGIHWELTNGYFTKRIMAPGCSLEALQWLTFIQETDSRLINSKGERLQVQHKYFRGEHREGQWDVDGFCQNGHKKYFYEFLGCYFHPGCKNSECQNFDPTGVDETFKKKHEFLEKQGEVITMRGCEWKNQLKNLKSRPSPSFPDIYNIFSNEKKLLSQIEKNQIFGFIVADVTTPADVLEKILPLNFPPIIHRAKIDETMLSEYMKSRCEARERKLPQETLIQSYHAKQLMIYTPTVQFYLELGLKITNVTKFIQFLPTKPLDAFVDKITKGRINAVKDGNDSLGCAYKVIGNA